MADSEKSFADRLQKMRNLRDALDTFTPTFSPADPNFSVTSLTTFITTVNGINGDVEASRNSWTNITNQREADVDTAKKRCTQIVNYVKSNAVWKLKFESIKRLCDKVRNIKPKRRPAPVPPPPPGATPGPASPPRDRGDGSYAEIAGNFFALLGALGQLGGYVPPDDAIKLAAITTLSNALTADNGAVSVAEQDLAGTQSLRAEQYYGPAGLAERFAGAKLAVKGQYGVSSPQWGQVKSMRW